MSTSPKWINKKYIYIIIFLPQILILVEVMYILNKIYENHLKYFIRKNKILDKDRTQQLRPNFMKQSKK